MPTNTYDESGRKLRECAETWTHDVAFWKSATGGSYHPTNCPCNGTGFVLECDAEWFRSGITSADRGVPHPDSCDCSGSGMLPGVPAFEVHQCATCWNGAVPGDCVCSGSGWIGMTKEQAAVIEGMRAYAWWKDGVQYVGTGGKTLALAIEDYLFGGYPNDQVRAAVKALKETKL